MVFDRIRVMTGLAAFAVAAAIASAPVYAQDGAAAATQITDVAQQSEETETGTPASAAAVLFGQDGSEAVDKLSQAKSSVAAEQVAGWKREAADTYLAEARMDSVKTVVGNAHLPAARDDTKMAVAAPNGYLNIHSDASLGSDVVGRLYSNDVAKILQDDGSGWVRVQSGDVSGYVLGDYLLSDSSAEVLTEIIAKDVATVATEDALVYYDKDEQSGVLCGTDSGEKFEVQEETDDWVKVSTEYGEGFIPKESADVAKVYPTAETAEQEAERLEASNVQDLLDHEKEKAAEADRVAQTAQEAVDAAAESAAESGEETTEELEAAQAAAEAAQNAADTAQEQVDAAQTVVDESGAEMGQAVVDYAMQFLGNPYVWGGSSLTNGTDCSGFTMSVYAHFGVGLAHYDGAQRGVGIGISSLAEARPGDLICYYGHVGIYIGDGQIIHAANEQLGITIGRADHQTISAIRRIFY